MAGRVSAGTFVRNRIGWEGWALQRRLVDLVWIILFTIVYLI